MGAKRQITRLVDLDDVNESGLADGDSPVWDAAAGEFTMEPGGGGGGGAPTTADYLVGTAQAGLSAEIVVGATPGGELGGAWAAPTVDAVHSGSSHAAVQSAAEATAAAALAGHDADTTNVHGIADTSLLATDADLQAMLDQAVILAPASSARNVIQPTAGDVIAAVVKAHAAQSVDLTQWQTSAAAVLTKIDSGGSWTIQPSVLGASGAALIDGGTLPTIGGNDPRRALLNFKAIASEDSGSPGDFYGARVGSYRDGNFDHTTLGKYDWMIDIYEDVTLSSPYMTFLKRRQSDRKATDSLTFSSSVVQIRTQDPDTENTIKLMGFSTTNGFTQHDIDDFLIYDTLFTNERFAFRRVTGAWKFGVFGSAPSPVVQQSASTVGALWTALKAYGWLDAGSSAPTVYEAGGTDVAVADGGTGASTAADARTNLGISATNTPFTPTGTIAATDSQAAVAEVASEAASALTTHESDTTNVHGIADTALLVAYTRPALSQQWYSPVPIYVAAVTAPTQSRLVLALMEFRGGITLDRLGINQQGAGVAGVTFRMGIYQDNGSCYPGALLLDAGTVDLSTANAVKTITISQAITTPGLYWVGGVAQGVGPPTLICIGSSGQQGWDRMPVDSATLFNKSVGFYQAGVTGALPANFTSTVNFVSTGVTMVAVRIQ